jgi:hypothetical protein
MGQGENNMLKFIGWAVVGYLSLIGVLYVTQRAQMYFPDRSMPDRVPDGAKVITTTTDDGLTLTHWFIPPASPDDPIILFFHGNAGHRGDRWEKTGPLRRAGFGLIIVDYRGYGGNPGKPTEEGLYQDGRSVIDWVRNNQPDHNYVLYGASLGSAVAVKMGMEQSDELAVVLEAPMTSALDIAEDQFWFVPVKHMMKDQFRSDQRIDKINSPLLIIHGMEDTTIPIEYGMRLFEMADQPKESFWMPSAGHVNAYEQGAGPVVDDFIRRAKLGDIGD